MFTEKQLIRMAESLRESSTREADITADLMKWNLMPIGDWEVKVTKTATMAFSKFPQHQIDNLFLVKLRRFNYKIRDEGVSQKPYDGFTREKSPAWCILVFCKDKLEVFAIDIEVFYNERRSGAKSLTANRSSQLGIRLI